MCSKRREGRLGESFVATNYQGGDELKPETERAGSKTRRRRRRRMKTKVDQGVVGSAWSRTFDWG